MHPIAAEAEDAVDLAGAVCASVVVGKRFEYFNYYFQLDSRRGV